MQIARENTYLNRLYTTGIVGYAGAAHIADRPAGGAKDFSALIAKAKTCPPPTEIETGTIVGGFAHHQVLALADKIVAAVKSGAIKRFVVMAGCDGRQKTRAYFTEMAENLPKDTVILTAGCAKYRYNKLALGDIGGIPRVLDAGQCNDSYSLAVIALKEIWSCRNGVVSRATMYMTRPKATPKTASPPERPSRTCPRTGYARIAARARTCSKKWNEEEKAFEQIQSISRHMRELCLRDGGRHDQEAGARDSF
jgi:hypothetical protein